MNDNFTSNGYEDSDRARVTGLGAGLRRLHELDDYEVADGNADVRGWEVRDNDGRRLGRVHDLIVSVSELRVRYLDIDAEDGGHALIPVEAAQIDGVHDDVVVNDVSVIRRNYQRTGSDSGHVEAHRHLDASVPTTPRRQVGAPVPTDAVRPLHASPATASGEIRVPLVHEEAVIEKRPVVREEIVIRRRMVRDDRPVEADLRRERLDIEGPVTQGQTRRANPDFTDRGEQR